MCPMSPIWYFTTTGSSLDIETSTCATSQQTSQITSCCVPFLSSPSRLCLERVSKYHDWGPLPLQAGLSMPASPDYAQLKASSFLTVRHRLGLQ